MLIPPGYLAAIRCIRTTAYDDEGLRAYRLTVSDDGCLVDDFVRVFVRVLFEAKLHVAVEVVVRIIEEVCECRTLGLGCAAGYCIEVVHALVFHEYDRAAHEGRHRCATEAYGVKCDYSAG